MMMISMTIHTTLNGVSRRNYNAGKVICAVFSLLLPRNFLVSLLIVPQYFAAIPSTRSDTIPDNSRYDRCALFSVGRARAREGLKRH